jgi:hypothetical protein
VLTVAVEPTRIRWQVLTPGEHQLHFQPLELPIVADDPGETATAARSACWSAAAAGKCSSRNHATAVSGHGHPTA